MTFLGAFAKDQFVLRLHVSWSNWLFRVLVGCRAARNIVGSPSQPCPPNGGRIARVLGQSGVVRRWVSTAFARSLGVHTEIVPLLVNEEVLVAAGMTRPALLGEH